jgi:hypothetical protein
VLVSSSLIRIQRACKSAEKVRSDREPIFMSNRITSKNGIWLRPFPLVLRKCKSTSGLMAVRLQLKFFTPHQFLVIPIQCGVSYL